MHRLRNKVTLLFLGIGTFGILGTTAVKTRSFLADKRNYVIEFNIVAAPHVASAIGNHLLYLRGSFAGIDDLMRSRGSSAKLLQNEFRRMNGVDSLAIYDRQGFVASIGGGGPGHTRPDEATLARLRGARTGAVEAAGKSAVYAAWVGDRLYVASLRSDVFSEHFELARATSVSLVTRDGTVLFRGSQQDTDSGKRSVVMEKLVGLLTREKEAAVATEVETAGGDRVFAALAPVPGTDSALVLVQAPVAQAVEMVKQVLRGSLPMVGLMLIVSLGAGLVFTARLVRPVEELTEATSKIAVGHWSVSIASRPNDEIGRLIDAFGRMGRELSAREESLKQAHEELARNERLASVGLLSAGVAHEIKNPLNSIMGFTELIRQGAGVKGNEELERYLGIIQSETRRATGIISELLTFARNKPPVLEPLQVAELVDFAFDLYVPQARKAGVEMTRDVRDPTLRARADRDQLCQVMSNLVTNAIQAMEELPAGESRRLALRLFREAGSAVIEVADTGPGIPKENLAKIFDPFFSSKKAGKGTGLGLSVSYSIVDQHGGRIEVVSSPGKGAAFRVRLPAIS